MAFRHNSRDRLYRDPFGAVRQGAKIILRAESDSPVTLRLWENESERLIPMTKNPDGLWEASVEAPKTGLIWYYFLSENKIYCAPPDNLGGKSLLHEDGAPLHSHQITVYDKDFAPPKWLSESIMYQIFPDRFYDGAGGALLKKRDDILVHADKTEPPYCLPDGGGENPGSPEIIRTDDFFGGNLPGIEQKLDYIKEMGFSAIYLNPVFKASSNHKYDTGDYHEIDPTFGTNEDFARLCEKAASMGIRIILDGVFSHTGADSVYFNKYGRYPSVGAYQNESSPYFDWYNFKNFPDDYDCWWGFRSLPNVYETDEGYIRFIINDDDSVVKKWLGMGASGWRLDVADELPDNFIEMIKAAASQKKRDSAIIGEVWEDATNKISYGKPRTYALGRGLDSAMNYPLRDALIAFFLGAEDSRVLRRRLDSQMENYPKELYFSLMNLIGSHDRSRIINILGECDDQSLPRCAQGLVRMTAAEYALGKSRLKKMAEIIFAMPGMPSVYYGDEAGLQGMRDPFCRAFFPWEREDADLQAFFRGLAETRRRLDILRNGFVRFHAPEPDVIEITRYYENGRNAFGEVCAPDAFSLRIDRREP